jgi:L-asparaginase II
VVESGAAKKFEFTSAELAVMTGSHSGEQHHIEAVKSILDKIGLNESHLQCGTHPPLYYITRSIQPERGEEFSPLMHNCSGKHVGMLAVAVHKGFSLEDYLLPTHPVQQMIIKTISEICCYSEEKIGLGFDGCSAPAHAMPLYNTALGYAHLIAPNSVPKEKAKAYSTINLAMMNHPEMVSGTGRMDFTIATSPGEPVISKAGAEAMACFALVNRNIGVAIKITDGSDRASHPVAVEFLYKMGVRTKNEALDNFHRPKIKNWRGIEIGFIEPGFDIVEGEQK